MTKTNPKQPTHEQIAMFGHTAAALRKVMADRGWNVADLNEACGWPRAATNVYTYLGSRGAPSEATRQVMSKTLHIPEEQLMPRDLSVPASTTVVPLTQIMRPMTTNPVLTFTVSADGTARIKLDAAMSLAAASPLLRILLDAGLVPSTQGDNTDGT